MAVVERLLLFCVTLLNTLSGEKKEPGEPYRFGKVLRALSIFSLLYPGVRVTFPANFDVNSIEIK